MKPPPHDLEAEAAVIGSMIYWPDTIDRLLGVIEGGDFHDPSNRVAFEFIESEHWAGRTVSEAGLVGHLKAEGRQVTPEWRQRLLEGSYDARHLRQADVVVAHRLRRDLQPLLDAASAQLPDYAIDPGEIVTSLQDRLTRIDQPVATAPDDFLPLGEFMAQDAEKLDPWVVPGLMRAGWRCIVVAGEGAGKSTLFRQFALCAASGKHPLSLAPMDPIRVLLCDFENPKGTVIRAFKKWSEKMPDLDVDRVGVWARNGGVDINTRHDRREFEAVILTHRPSLVLLGPIYKLYESEGKGDIEATAAATRVLDDLRTRHGFGLMMEHHAPHDRNREMRPIGSSRWRRWADIGFSLTREDKKRWHPLVVTPWRGDRDEASWPLKLDKGDTVPWVGVWPDGTFDNQGTF